MPGLWGIVSENELGMKMNFSDAFHREPSTRYLEDHISFKKANFGRFSVNKFPKDKVFRKTEKALVCSDGIVLNLSSLLLKYHAEDFCELAIKLYDQYSWKFVDLLRGNFAFFLYYHNDNKALVFSDHLAAKPVYYYYDKNSRTLIFASELKVVSRVMRQFGFARHLDIDGAYCLLTFGYMLGDLTLVREIRKLLPGNVLIYESGEIEIKEYYRLSSAPYIEDAEDEITKELDRRFREAIRLEYEKDAEGGYSHLATLSGGLDSRTNVAYAKKMGYDNITCFTFSESNYLDEKIAKQICSDHHFQFVFYALDNGDYLTNHIDEIIESNDGLVLYGGAAHQYNCLRNLSLKDYGLIHTGEMGDGLYGFLKVPYHTKAAHDMKTYSSRLIQRVQSRAEAELARYPNSELFKLYNRGINGVFNGYRMIEQFTEFSSPFLYKDFLDYVLRIHPKYRYKGSVYLKWINAYLPEFSKYKWEHCGVQPRYPSFIRDVSWLIRAVSWRIFRERPKSIARRLSMNPLDCWWRYNKTLQRKILSIFEEKTGNLDSYPYLQEDSTTLFKEGTLLEKTQVLTLITAIEILNLTDERTL